MLEVQGKEQGQMLEFTVEGTATQEDLATFKEVLKAKTLQEEPLNMLFIFKNIEGVTAKALLENLKTFPLLKSINKGAIVADGTFTKLDEVISNIVPGIEVAHFPLTKLEAAREWLQE